MNPVYTINGNPVSEAICGESIGSTIGFDVPGYPQAWVVVAQNGRITFDGPMDLPMQPYTLRCPDDIGNFQVAAYEITNEGTRGAVIGQTLFTVRSVDQPSPVSTSLQPVQPPAGAPYAPSSQTAPTTGTPPPMGQVPYTPLLPPVDVGGGPPIQYVGGEVAPGFFDNISPLAIGALVLVAVFAFSRKGNK